MSPKLSDLISLKIVPPGLEQLGPLPQAESSCLLLCSQDQDVTVGSCSWHLQPLCVAPFHSLLCELLSPFCGNREVQKY